MRGERFVTIVGDGAHVGVGEKSQIEERPDFELTLDAYDARNVGGMGMGVDEDDWEKDLKRLRYMQDYNTSNLLKQKTMVMLWVMKGIAPKCT